jgi:GTPase Era involved in 16S rRNA processing
MIEAQKKMVDYCKILHEKALVAGISEKLTEKLPRLADEVKRCELVVPIIGAFSSGKSSLINSLLNSDILPVAITPETSLATELHYSDKECIEAVKVDETFDCYKIEEIKTVAANSSKYVYARLYLRNERLRDIAPLVLVDMPGFDSPLDAHNKAIMAYLGRGCHYIILSSVEEGTISASLLRRLKEIDGLGRDFTFFLTKSDLRHTGATDELVRHFDGILQDNFDYKAGVVPLNSNSNEEVGKLLKCLATRESNALFFRMYKDQFSDICQDLRNELALKISASQKDVDTVHAAIKEMEESITKLQKKADEETTNIQQRYSSGMVNDILIDVGNELEFSLDELVSAALSGNEQNTKSILNDIVRSALTVSLRNRLGEVNQLIVTDFSESIKDLDKIMKNLAVDDNYLKNMAGEIQSSFNNLQSFFQEKGNTTKFNHPRINTAFKAITGVLAATTNIVAPVFEVILIFLPEIIQTFKSLLGGQRSKDAALRSNLRSKFQIEVFPVIKRKIRAELPAHLDENLKIMVNQVREAFAEKIAEQQDATRKAVEEKSADIAKAEEDRAKLELIRSEVQTIATDILEAC